MKKNFWHKTMYDHYYADSTLNSEDLRSQAKYEVSFIKKTLALPKQSIILDVPCGTGRHSYLFAKHGFKVTGVDISESCIEIAKKQWSHDNCTYQVGDMSNLNDFYGQYDVVLNLFTSFGYFNTDTQNKKVLKEFYNTLKPGGKLVIHLINRDWLLNVYRENDWCETKDKYILNKRSYNSKNHYNEAWMTVVDKKTKEEKNYYHKCRLYSKGEMVSLLKDVGFKMINVFGDCKGNKFKKDHSTHPFYFATK
jgi:2-polyprenyl-3-methyl-5-hydroxy-6-metoxy-1,4-benzoquinol methylase